MNQGFWSKLKKPFFVMAPMADVTDAAFRRLFAECGKPDVTWTEFVSADGLILAHEEGKKKLLKDFIYTEAERPIVAQLFGANPENMKKAAALVLELGFDGVDINMGCPDKSIEKQGAGAAMIKNSKLAREIIRAAKEGAKTDNGGIPVSVKTRIGYNSNELETWLPELLAEEPAAITIHARTRKELSLVPARWEHVKRGVEIRDELQKDKPQKTLILGNGDVLDLKDAEQKAQLSGADGVMLGRAIFGNPWRFNKEKDIATISLKERLEMMVRHTKLFDELLGDIKSFAVMKKHYKAYVNGFDGAAELRGKLMEAQSPEEVEIITKSFLDSNKLA
jgi:nifR3 family TIM-barrel protein